MHIRGAGPGQVTGRAKILQPQKKFPGTDQEKQNQDLQVKAAVSALNLVTGPESELFSFGVLVNKI